MSTTPSEPKTIQLRVRAKSHAQLSSLAARHRISLIDAAELAIEIFAELPVRERRALIDGEPRRKPRPPVQGDGGAQTAHDSDSEP